MHAPILIATFKGPSFITETANTLALVAWGKSEEEVINKPLFEVSPELEESLKEIFCDIYSTGKPFIANEIKVQIKRTGKMDTAYFNAVYKPLINLDNKIYGIVMTGTEVTEAVNAQKEIKASEHFNRTILESSPDCFKILDREGRIQYMNFNGICQMEIENFDAVKNTAWWQFWGEENKPLIDGALAKALSGNTAKFQAFCPTLKGTPKWWDVIVKPVLDNNNEVTQLISVAQDITERIKMEQSKDDFISIASHEMKTPLTSAKGYIELLMLSLGEENQNALYAAKANQAIQRLHDLVVELLDTSKIQNGKLNYNVTTFDFNKLVDETIENIQFSSKKHEIKKIGNSLQPITADKERLQQVLINLLSNAIKYSPNANEILLRIEELDNKMQVSIQDFGIGMSNQHLGKIFDRYYRVQEHAIFFQGLGIGLYISNNIIERHQGKMWAESEPEKGSTFYFNLPI